MKFSSFLIFVLILSFSYSQENTQLLKVDTEKSRLFWVGEKPSGSHEGYVNLTSGEISISLNNENDSWKIVGGNFIIDMNSIECIDLQGSSKESIEGHLKNEDFFDVVNYPKSKFEIKSSSENSIKGDMTIKGITKSIEFEYKGYMNNGKLTIVANIVVDRTEFGINYASKSVFSDLADKFINDEFSITLEPIIFQ